MPPASLEPKIAGGGARGNNIHRATWKRNSAKFATLPLNARLCSPPLQTAELELIATSAARHEPGNMAPHPDRRTLEALDLIAGELMSRDWLGMGAKSSRDVYAALIVAARRHGRMIPAGVRVSIGLRPLALAAAVGSVNTVRKALDRLRLAGLIRRDDGNRRGTDAGAFVLIPPAQR